MGTYVLCMVDLPEKNFVFVTKPIHQNREVNSSTECRFCIDVDPFAAFKKLWRPFDINQSPVHIWKFRDGQKVLGAIFKAIKTK